MGSRGFRASTLCLCAAGAVGFYVVRHTRDLVVGTTQSGETLSVGECLDETPQGHLGGAEAGGSTPSVATNLIPTRCTRYCRCRISPLGIAALDEIVVNCQSQLQKYSPSVAREPGRLDQRLNGRMLDRAAAKTSRWPATFVQASAPSRGV